MKIHFDFFTNGYQIIVSFPSKEEKEKFLKNQRDIPIVWGVKIDGWIPCGNPNIEEEEQLAYWLPFPEKNE